MNTTTSGGTRQSTTRSSRPFAPGATTEGKRNERWDTSEALDLPLRWRKPRRVFVDSMSDLFHPDVPFDFVDRVFAVMALTPRHTYQILTKRPERMAEYVTDRSQIRRR